MTKKNKVVDRVLVVFLAILSVVWVTPVFLVVLNSFKKKTTITKQPFAMLNSSNFVGLQNYTTGIEKTNFFSAFGWSLFITVFSVAAIVLFTGMTAWMITRVDSKLSKVLYNLFIFSMIVPFQMVMFTMSNVANQLRIDTPWGLILIYLGFGSGLSIFIYSGFIRSIPIDMEEAAMIDGCTPVRMFFSVIFPVMRPTAITVAILNAMWVWNDYLLPNLVIGSKYHTIPIAVQYLRGGYGSIDMGAQMAMLVLSIIPIIAFYFSSQKHIIEGVIAGAVKG